jgi:hypothetical protein
LILLSSGSHSNSTPLNSLLTYKLYLFRALVGACESGSAARTYTVRAACA